jgi:flagellar basal body-associated protein FliL
MSMAKLKNVVVLVVMLSMFTAGAGGTAHWMLTETSAMPEPAAQKAEAESILEA